MLNKILLLLLIFSSTATIGQNLVHNYSFETASMCAENTNMLNIASYWNNPSNGTSDYFTLCTQEACPANYQKLDPSICALGNWKGEQLARTGYRYGGFFASISDNSYSPATPESNSSLREYIQVRLSSPLITGEKYHVEFYTSLGDKSAYTVSEIGAFLSVDRIGLTNSGNFECCDPQVVNTSLITDRENWVKVSGCIIADGGESYITIGNFQNDTECQIIEVPGSFEALREAYYYVDDVAVVHLKADLGPDQTICAGDSFDMDVFLDASTSDIKVNYLWQDGSTLSTYTASEVGIYSVEVSVDGCAVTDSIEFFHHPLKSIDLGPYEEICLGDTIRLDATNPNASYVWQDGSTNNYYDAVKQGQYWVEVSDQCGPEKAYKDIGVSSVCDCELYVPNTFTPNDDGVNDTFIPVSECYFTDYHILIFNRAGEVVFESKDPTRYWDGKMNGNKVQTGVYNYYIRYLSFGKNRKELTGHLVILG